MTARWYKRCGADFIHGTMMLSLEEKGAYSLCLDLIYDRGGPIPDDARWLSGVCGVSIRKWNAIRQRLLDLGKLATGHGLLSNARADVELVSAALSARERAESGAKGGRKRAENADVNKKNNDLGQAELKREDKIREDKKVDPGGSTARAKVDPFPCPEGVDPQDWAGLIANRKAKRAGLSEGAHNQILAKLHRWAEEGWPPGPIVANAAELGWTTVFPTDEMKAPRNGRSAPLGRHQPANDGLSATTRAALRVFGDCDEGGVPQRADQVPSLGGPVGHGRAGPG